MSITGISNSLLGGSPVIQPTRRQSEDQIGRQLEQDLQNGDLTGAQQAYQQLAAFGPNNSGPFTDPTMKAEFQNLGQDLQSGNLSAAKSDNSSLTTNLLNSDVQAVIKNSNGGNQEALNNAIANLKGDYWAVYGQQPGNSQLQAMISNNPPINVQA